MFLCPLPLGALHVFPSLLFSADVLIKAILITFCILYQALAFLTLSLQNWAVYLYSSWSPNRLKSALLRPRDVILLFALIPLES